MRRADASHLGRASHLLAGMERGLSLLLCRGGVLGALGGGHALSSAAGAGIGGGGGSSGVPVGDVLWSRLRPAVTTLRRALSRRIARTLAGRGRRGVREDPGSLPLSATSWTSHCHWFRRPL